MKNIKLLIILPFVAVGALVGAIIESALIGFIAGSDAVSKFWNWVKP